MSNHLGRFFEKLGVAAFPCVGVADAPKLMARHDPDVVICDYDLLATTSLENWEQHMALSEVPVIAVSLTRHPGEAHLMDVNGIAGFLDLPTLVPDDAQRLLTAVSRKGRGITPPTVLPWPGSNPVAEIR